MPTGVYKRTKPIWNKGKKCSDEWRANMSKSRIGNKSRWLGMMATYCAKHSWIRKHYGRPSICENINCFYPRKNNARRTVKAPKMFHWANVSGKYYREKEDWIRLCSSCHKRWDMGLIEVNGIRKECKKYWIKNKVDMIKKLENN